MQNQPIAKALGPSVSRAEDIMIHLDRYMTHGIKRLAEDARLHPSTVSRFLSGRRKSCFRTISRITQAFERQLGFAIDPREVIAENGEFPTPYVCDLLGCKGCLPPNAYDEFEDLKPTFQGVRRGQWVCSLHPHGFKPEGRLRD